MEKTPRKFQFGKKSAKVYHFPYSSIRYRATAGVTVNIHVSQVWLKQRKVSSHPPSLICPFPISPSLIPPSPNPPSYALGQFDY